MSNLAPSPLAEEPSARTPSGTGPGPEREPPAALVALGHFVFRYRDALAPLAIVLVVLLTSPRPGWGNARHDRWLDAIGLGVAACGQALRVLVIGLAYIQRGGKNKRIAGDHLVTDGVFAHCRHPLYVGNFLLITGLLIIWNAPWAYAIAGGLIALALFAMASAEDAYLQRTFGAEQPAMTTFIGIP
jgi:protein-S-isoprenylcysteine O-methyltransferase Ste14